MNVWISLSRFPSGKRRFHREQSRAVQRRQACFAEGGGFLMDDCIHLSLCLCAILLLCWTATTHARSGLSQTRMCVGTSCSRPLTDHTHITPNTTTRIHRKQHRRTHTNTRRPTRSKTCDIFSRAVVLVPPPLHSMKPDLDHRVRCRCVRPAGSSPAAAHSAMQRRATRSRPADFETQGLLPLEAVLGCGFSL